MLLATFMYAPMTLCYSDYVCMLMVIVGRHVKSITNEVNVSDQGRIQRGALGAQEPPLLPAKKTCRYQTFG